LNYRKTSKALTEGKFTQFVPFDGGIYVYFRYDNDEKVMVVLSLNKMDVSLNLKRFKEMLPESFNAFDIISGKKLEVANSLLVPANKSMILEIK
jgi:hypothetical protein